VDLVVLVGLQGSGKTTFYRTRFAATHAHVSMDLLRSARDRRARERALVAEAAALGRSVVVDDTNVRREDRAALVRLAAALGMRPVCYLFPPDVRGALARNARRAGRARVPPVAIHATRARFEPPGEDEGFAEIWRVEAAGDGAFEVAR
jgi:predicted kinase